MEARHVEQHESLKLSTSSDPYHSHKTLLLGLGALLLIIIGSGIGYYLGNTRNQEAEIISSPLISPTITQPIFPGEDSQASESNGIAMVITPEAGPPGTYVTVSLSGIPSNTNLPFANIGFMDSTGEYGEASTTEDNSIDTRKVGENGTYNIKFKIPEHVLVFAHEHDQNPTKPIPTTVGVGFVIFSYNDPNAYKNNESSDKKISVPFTVTK